MTSVAVRPPRPAASPAFAGTALEGRWELVAILAIAAAAAAIRFATLGEQSLWADEATTFVSVLRADLGHTLGQVGASESNPYLYYALAWVWTRIFGATDVGLRSLSAVIGTATVPVAWWAGRTLVSRAAGTAAAALVATSPFMVWYSQEARPYALLALTSAVALGFFGQAVVRRSPRPVVWWAVASGAALTTHYFAIVTVAAEAVALLLLLPELRRAVTRAVAGLAALCALLLPLALHQAGGGHAEWIPLIPLGTRIGYLVQQYLVGYYHGSPAAALGAIAAVPAVAVAAVAAWTGLRARQVGWLACAAIGLATIAVPLAGALLGIDFFFPRNAIASWVPLAIAAGAAASVRRVGPVVIAAAVAASLTVTIAIDADTSVQRTDWRDAARALGPATRTRAVIGANTGSHPLEHYLPRSRRVLGGAVTVSEIDVLGYSRDLRPRRRPPPPGFRLFARGATPGFVFERYLAAGPRIVSIRALSRLRIGVGHAPIMVQPPR
ncbi:MAG: glycosyltransferase family 39 protein [Actinobacteria bacterium]|nr:glycosyltransferase family 39 protein [Actinomycetota bacterium]